MSPSFKHTRKWVLIVAMISCVCMTDSVFAEPVTGLFEDSQGRSLMYRYELPEGIDLAEPTGIVVFFHGNSSASQEAMLNAYLPFSKRAATRFGLVPVAVASPETRVASIGRVVRHWYPPDESLIHELFQSHFEGAFTVDFNRVFLWGGSQGTCFLNEFVPRYAEFYGGGLHAWCGCSYTRDPLWQPSDEFKSRFRVFVQDTTEDFLWYAGVDSYGYYRYTIGLETRSDLATPGGHCAYGEVTIEDAFDWLVKGEGLDEEPEHIHLERRSRLNHISSLASDEDGALWVVRSPPGRSGRLWRSVDGGTTMVPVSEFEVPISDIDASGNALIASHAFPTSKTQSLLRSTDLGSTFEEIEINGIPTAPKVVADRQGRIFLALDLENREWEIAFSSNQGDTWERVGNVKSREQIISNTDSINVTQFPAYLFLGQPTVHSAIRTDGGEENEVTGSPDGGEIHWMAWDGSTFWGLGESLYSLYNSTDAGLNWMEVSQPEDADRWWSGTKISVLEQDQLFILAARQDGLLRDAERSWHRVYGSGFIKSLSELDHHVVVSHTNRDSYISAGRGIFRLDARFRPSDLPTAADADSDGIPDALDDFPMNESEFLDSDGDGTGNNADDDDDGDGVRDIEDAVPLDPGDSLDSDGDGIGDNDDLDDDNDGVRDIVDAFPFDSNESADTDGDGIGNWEDKDDDGDGVPDVLDAFPLFASKSIDTDGDGIDDETDWDDDNDGRHDRYDPAPTDMGESAPSLRFGTREPLPNALRVLLEIVIDPNPELIYPEVKGDHQAYGEIVLSYAEGTAIAFMVDSLGDGVARVYFDANQNADLTDDGPPQRLAAMDPFSLVGHVSATFNVGYQASVVVPYSIHVFFQFDAEGQVSDAWHEASSSWSGRIQVLGDGLVTISTSDFVSDGIFTGTHDYVCIDIDGDGAPIDCEDGSERFEHGSKFKFNGRQVEVLVAASGHHVEIGSREYVVPYMPPASHESWEGIVQISNRDNESGSVEIHAYDDSGAAYGPLTLEISAHATKFFNSSDLENGNENLDLNGSIGEGDGAWRLTLDSDLKLDVFTYVQTANNHLARMHDLVPRQADGNTRVPIFNHAGDSGQVSSLRLINPSENMASVTIRGIDDEGVNSGSTVELQIPSHSARWLTAQDLEMGAEDLEGSLDEGTGKWQLIVASEQPIQVMNLLESPNGTLTNLSSPSYEDGGPLHQVSMFPSASNEAYQGFLRIVNRSDDAGDIGIVGYDDVGDRYGPVTIQIAGNATAEMSADDLENGNEAMGFGQGFVSGAGDWWLEIESDLNLDVFGYARSSDGSLTSMHDAFHRDESGVHVPVFNMSGNEDHISELRLVNPSDDIRTVSITGVDGNGQSLGTPVVFSIAPRATRMLVPNVSEVASEGDETDRSGIPVGNWRLTLQPDGPLRVMSLLKSDGVLSNLSTLPRRFPSDRVDRHPTPAPPIAASRPSHHGRSDTLDERSREGDEIVVSTETLGTIYYQFDYD